MSRLGRPAGAAKELHDLLQSRGVQVWFSEKDVGLGVPLLRAIDKGLANSKVGIVLVTPALLRRLPAEGIADKELSALLARERLVSCTARRMRPSAKSAPYWRHEAA
jgi:TIR domain